MKCVIAVPIQILLSVFMFVLLAAAEYEALTVNSIICGIVVCIMIEILSIKCLFCVCVIGGFSCHENLPDSPLCLCFLMLTVARNVHVIYTRSVDLSKILEYGF